MNTLINDEMNLFCDSIFNIEWVDFGKVFYYIANHSKKDY